GNEAVERHDVPRAEIVAVVPLGGIARRGPEVGEVIGGGRARVVLVIAKRGGGARFVPPPARGIAVLEVRERSARVNVVADREDGAGDRVEDGRRGRITSGGAARNGPGPNERDGRRRHCDARRGRGGGAGGPARVGDGERHSIGAVVRVCVSWPHAGAGAPVAEAPAVGERIPVG